ncbi:hypothetical protein TOPH_02651 [Tolypocladium ophioglossoides CBS 100239]|uniref:Uncharacterized protein n=1 Tax=Tolypocladium ophioglossoides (strain CBS 100239) TaxID=1163406 RepID=A0A0L0NEJ9_TOLOC|nr:hypothetical protein TOPH_02651 [Tolypocladium ophioglossoides CBS 100239]
MASHTAGPRWRPSLWRSGCLLALTEAGTSRQGAGRGGVEARPVTCARARRRGQPAPLSSARAPRRTPHRAARLPSLSRCPSAAARHPMRPPCPLPRRADVVPLRRRRCRGICSGNRSILQFDAHKAVHPVFLLLPRCQPSNRPLPTGPPRWLVPRPELPPSRISHTACHAPAAATDAAFPARGQPAIPVPRTRPPVSCCRARCAASTGHGETGIECDGGRRVLLHSRRRRGASGAARRRPRYIYRVGETWSWKPSGLEALCSLASREAPRR